MSAYWKKLSVIHMLVYSFKMEGWSYAEKKEIKTILIAWVSINHRCKIIFVGVSFKTRIKISLVFELKIVQGKSLTHGQSLFGVRNNVRVSTDPWLNKTRDCEITTAGCRMC